GAQGIGIRRQLVFLLQPARNPPSSCPVHVGTLWLATDLLAKGFACRKGPKIELDFGKHDAEIFTC
ncbi:hypothetical protein, partial [Mesorhizobium sp.]|uniref:hypothetical protein n=1 Tax=Mesorhizobium sp. TaxID=1871066 RepID=UPI00257CA661